MTFMTKALAKGTLGTVAAGAMAMTAVSPAAANDRYRDRDRGGISAGEVIAGAVVLGGIAAILSSGSNKRDRYRDRDYRDRNYRDRDYRGYNGYDNRNSSRNAVEACVRAAERQAQRYTGGRAEVYEIRDIDRERRGFEVKGRIAVQDNYYRGRGNYRRGYNNRDWDEGRFTCDFRRGRVVDIDYSGIRGLR